MTTQIYFPQSPRAKPRALSVRALIEALEKIPDKNLPVIFQEMTDGKIVGSAVTFDTIKLVDLPETVVEFGDSQYNYTLHAWRGVILG
jgi:hypothetical protein